MIKKYSEEKRQEVIEARKAGLTIAQIAAQTGVGQTTIKSMAERCRLKNCRDIKAGFKFLIIRKSRTTAENLIFSEFLKHPDHCIPVRSV